MPSLLTVEIDAKHVQFVVNESKAVIEEVDMTEKCGAGTSACRLEVKVANLGGLDGD